MHQLTKCFSRTIHMTTITALDGSVLEGGGQLLRNAIAYSALLSKPLAIQNVRGNRKPSGLRNQHAAGIRLVAEICSATVTGGTVGSGEIVFTPSAEGVKTGFYKADPGTAGSTTLLLQVSLPCLLFAHSEPLQPSSLRLLGGTNASQAPQIDYTIHVLLPFLQRQFGIVNPLSVHVSKRGYYPRGGGVVDISIPPLVAPLPAVRLLERGRICAIHGRAHVSGLPERMAHAMSAAAESRLVAADICSPDIINIEAHRVKDTDSVGAGAGITLWAETDTGCFIGGSALGSKRGDEPEAVGRSAAEELLRNLEHGGCVDEYLQDQMLIFLALADGTSEVLTGSLTLHTRTAIWVAEQLTSARFQVQHNVKGGTQCIIRCTGIGYHIPD